MYIKKRWLVLFIILFIGVPLYYVYSHFFQSDDAQTACCQKYKVVVPPIFNITESTPIGNLDSSEATESISFNILNQIEEGLMRLGPDNMPIPGLAESYQVSPDYKTYTFTIRKHATWSDGKPITAEDFLYAWQHTLSPANHYAYSYLFYPIHNAEAVNEGKISADGFGVFAPDSSHLIVHLDKPDPNFLSLVTFTPFFPLRQDLVEKYGSDYTATPEQMSFSGPFLLKTVTPKKAVLMKNNMYWDKAHVNLPEVNINVEVDPEKQVDLYNSELTGMMKLDPHYISQLQTKANLIAISKATTDYIEMNEQKQLLQNIHIRKAIQLALKRNDMVAGLKDGSTVANEIVPPTIKTYTGESFHADFSLQSNIDEAKADLAQGLKEVGISNPPTLTLLTYNFPHFVTLASYVQKQLKEIGLHVMIKKYDPSQKSELDAAGKYDLSISEWVVYNHDPSSFLGLWHSGTFVNISGFHNQAYDRLLDQAANETDPNKQISLYKQAEQFLIVNQAVIVPLVYTGDLRLQKPYVHNVYYHPFGAEYSLKWATYSPKK